MTPPTSFTKFADTQAVRNTLKERSVRGVVFMAAGGVVDMFVRLSSTLILARLLVPEHFGLIGMITAITGVAQQFSSLGLSTATVQASQITHKQCSNLFWINTATGVAFALAICAAAPAISVFYNDTRLFAITLAISTNFLWSGLSVQHDALLTRQMKQPQLVVNRLVAGFLSAAVAVSLALGGWGFWALVWREVIGAFLSALGVWILCPWLPGIPGRGTGMAKLLRFGGDMTLTQVLSAIISRIDGILIGKFAGPFALGLYRQAYNLLMMPLEQLNSPIQSVSQPALSVLRSDAVRYRRYYERIVFVVCLVTMPLGVLAVFYAKEMVLVVLGHKWIGATIFLQIFGVMAAIRPAVATSGIVLITCGMTQRFLVVATGHSLALLILMVCGIPWGAVGICIAQALATVILLIPKLYYSFAGTPVDVRLFLRASSKPIIGSLSMGAALVFLRSVTAVHGPLWSLLTGCGLGGTVYFLSLFLIPGGWVQLKSIWSDLFAALNRQSLKRDHGSELEPV